MTSTINYSPKLAEQGIVDARATQLIETWRENSGLLNHNFTEHMSHLNHFANPIDNSGLADLLFVGDNSYLASVYGEEWVQESPENRVKVDQALLAIVSEDYECSAQSYSPRLDLLSTPIALPQGGEKPVNYFRLILPFKLKRGNITLFSYASPVQQ